MTQVEYQIYEFEGFRLDPAKRLLFKADGDAVPLMPKAFDVLKMLVENAGTIVEKDDLMSAIWPDTVVEENNLTQNISALRRILGEKHRENRFIATVPGRGYKFVATVDRHESGQTISEKDSEGSEFADAAASSGPHTASADPQSEKSKPRSLLYTLLALVSAGIILTYFVILRSELRPDERPIRSLAVLPFKPLTADNRDEPLELGMADTLIMKLGSEELIVRPLSTVRRFSSIDQDPIEAGRILGVDAVLDGNIQNADGRLRVTVKLVRVADGRQIWANQFDERLSDIFSVQDSISDRVAASLKLPQTKKEKRYTHNVEAYQLYMKGLFHSSRLIRPEVDKGIEYFRQAVDLDPNYALAYVAMAQAYRTLVLSSDASALEVMPRSKAAAEKAIAIDPALSESWTALASTNFWFDFDWKAAEEDYKKAIDLDPNSAMARMSYAHLLSNLGRNDEALAEFKKAGELDPVNLITLAAEGQALYFAGRDDESIATLKRVVEMDDRFWLAHLFLTRPLIRKGMYAGAIAAAETAWANSGGNAEALATIGYIQAITGRREEALETQRQLEKQAGERYVPPYDLAQIHVALGEKEQALSLLERSFENRDALLVFLRIESKWDSLRGEERFVRLLEKMKL